jgi:hypothetical protein
VLQLHPSPDSLDVPPQLLQARGMAGAAANCLVLCLYKPQLGLKNNLAAIRLARLDEADHGIPVHSEKRWAVGRVGFEKNPQSHIVLMFQSNRLGGTAAQTAVQGGKTLTEMDIFHKHRLRNRIRIAGTRYEATGSPCPKSHQGFPTRQWMETFRSWSCALLPCSKLSLAPARPPVLPLTVP